MGNILNLYGLHWNKCDKWQVKSITATTKTSISFRPNRPLHSRKFLYLFTCKYHHFSQIKQQYANEKYLNLIKLENRKEITRLRTHSRKLGSIYEKWYNKVTDMIYKLPMHILCQRRNRERNIFFPWM